MRNVLRRQGGGGGGDDGGGEGGVPGRGVREGEGAVYHCMNV